MVLYLSSFTPWNWFIDALFKFSYKNEISGSFQKFTLREKKVSVAGARRKMQKSLEPENGASADWRREFE